MKNISLRIFFLMVLMIGSIKICLAQTTVQTSKEAGVQTSNENASRQDITIESNSFEIFPDDQKESFIVRLEATYNRTKKEMTVKFLNLNKDGEKDSFVIGENLNLNTFRYNMTQILVKYAVAENAKFFQEYGIQQVYLWLYSLVTDDASETIGTLSFRPALQVMNTDSSNFMNSSKREKIMLKYMRAFQEAISQRNTTTAKAEGNIKGLLTNLKTLQTNWDSGRVARPANADTNRIKSLISEVLAGLKNRTLPMNKINDSLNLIDVNLFPIFPENFNKHIQDLASDYENAKKKIDAELNKLQEKNIFSIKNISITFERGHIERIQVWVEREDHEVHIFENTYAIGFSSINNYKAFDRIRLWNRKSNYNTEFIFLSDVIASYDNLLQLYTRDYSPADISFNNIDPIATPNQQLQKERNIRLFDSRIYTDIAGFSEENPNGLVQVELSRRWNINTTRRQVASTRSDFSGFMYANLTATLSKIENKDRVLPLRNAGMIQNGAIISPSYATNLDLRRYENSSIQFDLNFFVFDWPDNKITFFVDGGVRYGRLRVQDSTRIVENGAIAERRIEQAFGASTITWYPRVTLELFSERRVGFTASYQLNNTALMSNNKFIQVLSETKSDLTALARDKRAKTSHMMELQARVETNRSGNGMVFARGRFFWQQGDANNFFPQIQLGYAYNILFRK